MQHTAAQIPHPAGAHWVNQPRDLFTVQQFAERRPAWSPAALRSLILNADDRFSTSGKRIAGNGLAEAGAIVRVGRRVLIDEAAFFRWIAEQQRAAPTKRESA
jgi:hypothetical protein